MKTAIFLDSKIEAQFRSEGYVILDLFNDEEIRQMQACYRTVEEMHSGPIGVSVLTDQLSERARISATLSPIFANRLMPLLNDYRIAVSSFVVKQQECAQGKFPLHQDPSFIDESEQAGLSIWCPLQDVDQTNGNLGIVPRSHLLNPYYRTTCMLPYPELESLIEERYIRYLPMRAGQVMIMDHRMIHGSPTNLSKQTRVVAVGVGVPRQLDLLYCHVDPFHSADVLEVYAVAEDFYLRNTFGQRPTEGQHLRNLPYQVARLTPEMLEQHCGAAMENAMTSHAVALSN
ncbi:phytanoyl-CoA dioxygenase family protein [Undibacterium seohonense]|uniref:Phytanoyl-CoA dioxygenase family protein n=1 Tax=Undibacterium seohonense TaxID=1344950 RepID=A0ABR6X5W9_9BURK|nr:phytanoyl-CoA dioxygenase family protein [Undibacterium seohonense]MBC3808340.1 phytanoyl-CoA dioxygenase family protein [Undibacterium seohonense]